MTRQLVHSQRAGICKRWRPPGSRRICNDRWLFSFWVKVLPPVAVSCQTALGCARVLATGIQQWEEQQVSHCRKVYPVIQGSVTGLIWRTLLLQESR